MTEKCTDIKNIALRSLTSICTQITTSQLRFGMLLYPQKVSHIPLKTSGKHFSDFYHHRLLVLPVIENHINRIIRYLTFV